MRAWLLLLLGAPLAPALQRVRPLRMDSNWRPKTVDPLGKAMGMPAAKENTYMLLLDMREAEVTFAQQAIYQLFYAVRRVVDEAGRALPAGAAVQGLLYDEARFERADTIGADTLPVFLQTADGSFVIAREADGSFVKGEPVPTALELRAPLAPDALVTAMDELCVVGEDEGCEVTTAMALPSDPLLWAMALTGLNPDELALVPANEGA